MSLKVFLKHYFADNVEVLLMDKEARTKKDLCNVLILLVTLTLLTYFSLHDNVMMLSSILCTFVLVVYRLLKKAIAKLCGANVKNDDSNLRIISVLLIGIIICSLIMVDLNDKTLAIVAGTIIELYLILIQENGFIYSKKCFESKKDTKDYLYAYKRIDDEYILCGNNPDRKEADKFYTIPITDIHKGDYQLEKQRVNNR